ncbi:hypothetical protein Celaphus_00018051, partial [Cervus elaphus hippelaphus]
IRMKGSLPALSPFPESLLNYCKGGVAFFRPGAAGDRKLDEASVKAIGCFRELCALCWMLHIRDKLSYSCRQYQKARESVEEKKVLTAQDEKQMVLSVSTQDLEANFDPCLVEHCLSAVEWAYRMLPFSRFCNIEELIQDLILSLIAELPPIRKVGENKSESETLKNFNFVLIKNDVAYKTHFKIFLKVAEIFVKAFPNPEDIRVSLREKYHSLQQRLRHCVVKGPQTEEMMSVIMHSIHKVRVKALKRVQRNIGSFEMNIWEPIEEEQPAEVAGFDRFSLGTSLSRSTLTELGSSLAHSDADTADTLSEALSAEEKSRTHFYQRSVPNHMELALTGKPKGKKKISNQKENPKRKEDCEKLLQNALPVIGIWEFERDDDEYIKFLELFLSYVLERDLLGSKDAGIPFLTSFSGYLREHELNSLLFDVHTTLKRRQGKSKSQNVFRAGSCFVVAPESYECEKSENQTLSASVLANQGIRHFSENPLNEVNKNEGKSGLFGLKRKSVYRIQDDKAEKTLIQRLSNHSVCIPKSTDSRKCIFKAIQCNDINPQGDLPVALNNTCGNIRRLLEWMIRWSDKRLLCDSGLTEPSCGYSPVIRVKTSAAAVLTSLWLLEQPYFATYKAKNALVKVLESNSPGPQNGPSVESAYRTDAGCSGAVSTQGGTEEINDQNESCQSILKISTEVKNPEIKGTKDEIISVTDDTEKEFVDIDEDLLEVEAFTQEEVDIYPSDCEVSACKEKYSSAPPLASNGVTVASQTPGPAAQPTQRSEPRAQLSQSSDSVRQMLQDEMFKLVQLQQINFMSLMQIVGSSFANLPDIHQLLQQSQSVHVVGSQGSNPTRGSNDVGDTSRNLKERFFIKPQPMGEYAREPSKNSPHCHKEIVQSNENSNGNLEHVPHGSAPFCQSEGQPQNRGLTPGSHSLPTTSLSPVPAGNTHLHLLSASSAISQTPRLIPTANTSRRSDGFPLLQFQPKPEFKPISFHTERVPQVPFSPLPQPREAWGLYDFSQPPLPKVAMDTTSISHLNLSQYNTEAIKKAAEPKKWAETIIKEIPKHVNVDQCVGQENLTPQQDSTTFIKPENIFDVKPGSFEISSQNSSGLPLLHLQLQPPYMFSSTSRTSVTVPSIPIRTMAEERKCPRLSLLHSCLGPENMSQKPQLIPLENLIAFKQRQQNLTHNFFEQGDPGHLQLLKVKIESSELRQGKDNKDDELKKNCKKKDQRNLGKNQERQEHHGSQPLEDFDISFEKLQDEVNTSAGLHFMASVKKKAKECQDASTNTDPEAASQEVVSECHKNKQVISSISEHESLNVPQLLAPDICLNLRLPTEISEKPLSPSASDTVGHTYINVIDIEADDLQELPVKEEPSDNTKQHSDCLEVPSSAELHYMAASVTNAIPLTLDNLKSKESACSAVDLCFKPATVSPSCLGGRGWRAGSTEVKEPHTPKPDFRFKEPSSKSDATEDYLLWEVLQEVPTARPAPSPAARRLEHLTAKLQRIDEQLLAIQNLAENIEHNYPRHTVPDRHCVK